MTKLSGKIALVTGATRGVGKGVALELAESGATVYATGRTIRENAFAENGKVIPVRCDHNRDAEVEAVFHRIAADQEHLDILVHKFWGGYENMIRMASLHGCCHSGSNRSGAGMRCLEPVSAPTTSRARTPLEPWSNTVPVSSSTSRFGPPRNT